MDVQSHLAVGGPPHANTIDEKRQVLQLVNFLLLLLLVAAVLDNGELEFFYSNKIWLRITYIDETGLRRSWISTMYSTSKKKQLGNNIFMRSSSQFDYTTTPPIFLTK